MALISNVKQNIYPRWNTKHALWVLLSVVLVCDWLHSVWQNHLYVMLLHNQGCRLFQSLRFRYVLQEVQRRFCVDSKSKMSDPKLPSERLIHASGCPLVSRRFEQFKLASIRTSQQRVRTLFRVPEESTIQMHPSERRGNTVWTLFNVRQIKGFPL